MTNKRTVNTKEGPMELDEETGDLTPIEEPKETPEERKERLKEERRAQRQADKELDTEDTKPFDIRDHIHGGPKSANKTNVRRLSL